MPGPSQIRQLDVDAHQILKGLPMAAALLEPVEPYRCVYANPVFNCWRWCGSNLSPGAPVCEVLSKDVHEPRPVLRRAMAVGQPQMLTGVIQPRGEYVPVAVVEPVTETSSAPVRTSLMLAALTDALETLQSAGGTASVHVIDVRSDPAEEEPLRVHVNRQMVERRARRSRLTWTEWQLFSDLLRAPGVTFSRPQLASIAWGAGFARRENEVEVYISRIRRKVEVDPNDPQLILTVRGAGYCIAAASVLRVAAH
jgi:hypothetical protein